MKIAVIGGDEREQEIARLAACDGATVVAYGFPWPPEGVSGVALASSVEAAFDDADFALFPIPGISAEGALFAPASPLPIVPSSSLLARMKKPASIILGWADENLKAAAGANGISLQEYEWDQDLMYLRGPAIVEGLLKIVIEKTRITIHSANVCVVGQGTIGSLLTRTLIALGARVSVAARNPVQRASAFAAGAVPRELDELPELAPGLDMLFSTVPHQIVGASVLSRLRPGTLVVDLAGPPGGIDLPSATGLGLNAVWARGLGRRAPVTVGASQWIGIRKRIESTWAQHAGQVVRL
ncbi:dipicolinate synthase subunit DpsA [Variovorax saccharolyticus]|uniref:dipicolinate synthase subunit DpsA n=1 Tax=Variovorax saccharolyticus TaxID=3053516 RepID=UPI002575CD84|nr:dipicolinate synthase subunit DpsA [Variovorax sp. J31P216]MDM0029991.1 dipicolinate synthase subunit DpsA [Variovorax sp. J31P216]